MTVFSVKNLDVRCDPVPSKQPPAKVEEGEAPVEDQVTNSLAARAADRCVAHVCIGRLLQWLCDTETVQLLCSIFPKSVGILRKRETVGILVCPPT
jgi:hypothetical protein